jgi:hypothetical protein
MESALRSATPAPGFWEIATTWHAKDELRPGRCGPYAEPTEPEHRRGAWELLGYDVADPTISGLSNCGYDPSEQARLAPEWSNRLNEHHLIADLDDAYAFLEITNQRVPEHAPFFVLGLWRVP